MTNTAIAQRELLHRLLGLTGQQKQALDAGDATRLNTLAKMRAKVISDAAAILPPVVAWEPEVADLVSALQRSTAGLQQSTGARMAAVRRQLVQLTKGSSAAKYLTGTFPLYQSSWKA
jgi:hypothetical protein